MEKIKEVLQNIWSIAFVQFIVYLAIAFVAAFLIKFIVTKLLKLLKIDAKLDKWGINEGQVGTSLTFVGKLVFAIVFLLFLPPALNAIGLESVSSPISDFVSACISYIPNIIAAVIIIFIGVFLGKIIGQVITVLLKKTKIDNLTKKIKGVGEDGIKLSEILGKIIYAVILLIAIVQGLSVLKIDAISTPALSIINSVFGAIPHILLAAIIIACGLLVANIACNLLENVLKGANFDGLVEKIIPQNKKKISATKVVVTIVKAVIILFIVAQGVDVLKLEILSNITSAVIAYLPMVISAVLIAMVALVGASMLEGFIVKTSPKAAGIAKVAKVAIFVLAGFMILSQLGIATTIVNSAFVICLAAVAVSFALAFGLGGKDFAKKTLDKVDAKVEDVKAEIKSEDNKEEK